MAKQKLWAITGTVDSPSAPYETHVSSYLIGLFSEESTARFRLSGLKALAKKAKANGGAFESLSFKLHCLKDGELPVMNFTGKKMYGDVLDGAPFIDNLDEEKRRYIGGVHSWS